MFRRRAFMMIAVLNNILELLGLVAWTILVWLLARWWYR
jgi:hypothetical protein